MKNIVKFLTVAFVIGLISACGVKKDPSYVAAKKNVVKQHKMAKGSSEDWVK